MRCNEEHIDCPPTRPGTAALSPPEPCPADDGRTRFSNRPAEKIVDAAAGGDQLRRLGCVRPAARGLAEDVGGTLMATRSSRRSVGCASNRGPACDGDRRTQKV